MAKIYRIISRLVPSFLSKKLKSFYEYSNIKIEYESFLGFVTVMSILIGVAGGFLLGAYFRQSFWIFFFSLSILTGVSIYLWLTFLVDKKASLIEDALPDALQLMASNLRAGMTPDKALLLSSRPEFGPLKTFLSTGRKKRGKLGTWGQLLVGVPHLGALAKHGVAAQKNFVSPVMSIATNDRAEKLE